MNKHEPPAMPGVPDPPDFLDAIALAEWRRIMPELQVRRLIEVIDAAVLATYVTAWSQLARAERALRIEGPVVIDTHGRMVASPHAKLAATARAQLIQAAREIGLSASSRTTVKAAPPPVDPERAARRREFFVTSASRVGS